MRLVGQRLLTIDLSTMTDLEDLNDSLVILYRISDPVGTLANPKALGLAGKFLAARCTRSARKALDSRHNPRTQPSRLDRFELLDRGRLDEDAIACHAAEGP